MRGLGNFKSGFQRFNEPRRPDRRSAPRLAACYQPGSGFTLAGSRTFRPADIKDISATGLYLRTDLRPKTGEEITVNLWEADNFESISDLQITLPARVARQGEDGIGLSFVLPQSLDKELWDLLLRNVVILPNHRHAAELFRTLRCVLFLSRLCPSEADEVMGLLKGRVNPDRTSVLTRIAIGAENLLAEKPDAERMQAHPKLVNDILRQGSWTAHEPTMRLWMGLLANSCSVNAPDDFNEVFARLLGHFTPTQTAIFVHGCKRALSFSPIPERALSGSIVLGPREMVNITGVHDPYRNATDLAHLFNLGLIQNVFDFTFFRPADSFDILPSRLGLELYRRCHGCQDPVAPTLVEVANAHLAHFAPAPRSADSDWSPESSLAASADS